MGADVTEIVDVISDSSGRRAVAPVLSVFLPRVGPDKGSIISQTGLTEATADRSKPSCRTRR